MTIEEVDRIICEVKLNGWSWVVRNAECYGMSPEQMFEFWERNQHMTPRDRFPYGKGPAVAGEMPAARMISDTPARRAVAR